MNRCPTCGGTNLTIIRRNGLDQRGMVSFPDELTGCQTCGYEFYTLEQSMANSRAHAAAVRETDGTPAPEAIRAARLALRMTQEQFERALGVGKKTVVRWERGTVTPGKGARGMLWVALNRPAVFLEYARTINPDLAREDAAVTGTISVATSSAVKAAVIPINSKAVRRATGHITRGVGDAPRLKGAELA